MSRFWNKFISEHPNTKPLLEQAHKLAVANYKTTILDCFIGKEQQLEEAVELGFIHPKEAIIEFWTDAYFRHLTGQEFDETAQAILFGRESYCPYNSVKDETVVFEAE